MVPLVLELVDDELACATATSDHEDALLEAIVAEMLCVDMLVVEG